MEKIHLIWAITATALFLLAAAIAFVHERKVKFLEKKVGDLKEDKLYLAVIARATGVKELAQAWLTMLLQKISPPLIVQMEPNPKEDYAIFEEGEYYFRINLNSYHEKLLLQIEFYLKQNREGEIDIEIRIYNISEDASVGFDDLGQNMNYVNEFIDSYLKIKQIA